MPNIEVHQDENRQKNRRFSGRPSRLWLRGASSRFQCIACDHYYEDEIFKLMMS